MECLKIHDIVREPVKLSFLYIKRTDPYVKGQSFSHNIYFFVITINVSGRLSLNNPQSHLYPSFLT